MNEPRDGGGQRDRERNKQQQRQRVPRKHGELLPCRGDQRRQQPAGSSPTKPAASCATSRTWTISIAAPAAAMRDAGESDPIEADSKPAIPVGKTQAETCRTAAHSVAA